MPFLSDPGALSAFLQVVMIDLVLAGDNAVVIGLAAAGLPSDIRKKAIIWGIAGATVLRIGLAVVTVQLLEIVGLLLAGGCLLLWVCWKMYQEIRHDAAAEAEAQRAIDEASEDPGSETGQPGTKRGRTKTMGQALTQIIVADISMSLDNVLAVAGAAHEHPAALGFGLVLSIALMGFAAAFIARLLGKHRWIAYVGLLVILFVAGRMIYEGAHEVWVAAPDLTAALG